MPEIPPACQQCNLSIQKLRDLGNTKAQPSAEDFLMANQADLPKGCCPVHSGDNTTYLCPVNQIASVE